MELIIIFEQIKYRLAAALSPKQMTRQLSRTTNTNKDNLSYTYRSDGLSYKDYDDMLKDPQIKSGYELIRTFLLSRKLTVTPASDDTEDQEIADELEKMFENMDYPMRKIRNDLYSALIYGYSVLEIVWKVNEEGNKVAFKRLRPIHIKTLEDCFKYNEDGDLEYIIQHPDDGDDIEIGAEKCLVYTYDECFGDRKGNSLLYSIYDNWFIKQKLLTWWNIYLQKNEGPTLVGYTSNPQFKDLMREQLEEVQEGRTNLTAGVEDRIEVLESSHRGEGFKEAINYHDTMIFRKMNIGTMILGQEDGKGAYAQSNTQNDMLNIFLDGIHNDISAELEILVKQVVDMNWNVEEYPKVSFESFEDEDLLGLLAALKPMIDSMAVDPSESWFKQLISKVVEKYSDITVDLEEIEPEQNVGLDQTGQPKTIPTVEEQQDTSKPEEIRQMEQAIANVEAR